MKLSIPCIISFSLSLILLGTSPPALADEVSSEELNEIKRLLAEQERMIRVLKDRVEELEERASSGEAPMPSDVRTQEAEIASDEVKDSPMAEVEEAIRAGRRAPVIYRHAMNDQQAAAARAGDYTLDPDYRGFFPIPNTSVLIKLNAKPRVDFIGNSGDPGADFRFIPAFFPPSNEDGWQFSATANASQLIMDVQAPSVAGSPRVYYQSDFFGDDRKQMRYRLQHLYGQWGGALAGFTFGVFEDPDAWPDTVDYEGPNSVIFARRALGQYQTMIFPDWELTLSLEDPSLAVDTTGDPGAAQRTRAPDGGFALRWTPGDLGHVRMSTIFRSIAVEGGIFDDDDVFGWGINLSGNLKLTSRDNVQFWFVYGDGVGGMGNDTGFVNSDAAFNSIGKLVALQYWSTMIALSHRWSPRWKSTLSHGYVNLENTDLQLGDAYHATHYASVNLVYQMFKRMRFGVEGLYGYKKVNDGRTNDIFRIQAGVAFSIFD